MLQKLVERIGNNGILNLIVAASDSAKSNEADPKTKQNKFTELGIPILKMLLETLEEDVCAWFADLIGKKPEDLDELPFDVELQILEQLQAAPEMQAFFLKASQLFKKIGVLQKQLSEEKTA